MKKLKKRLFAVVLVAFMLTAVMPAAALYASAETESVSGNAIGQEDMEDDNTGADTAKCICETLCTEDSINGDCPVCGVDGASLLDCKGKVSEENMDEQGQNDLSRCYDQQEAPEEGTPDLELFGQTVCSGDSGDGWSYADGVLTLEDFHADNSGEVFIHITNADLEFTLYVKGRNSVKTSEILFYGNAFGSMTITGDTGASLSLEGKNWNDRYIFIRGVNVDVTTQGMIFLAYDMEIDNATVNINMNGSNGYIYTTHGSFTVKNGSDVTITNLSGVADYCVATNKAEISGSTLKLSNPSGFGMYVTKLSQQASEYKASVANSTISADVLDAAIHCEEEVSVANSQVTGSGSFLLRSKKEITVDDSSTMEGITYEFFKSDTGAVYRVYGSHTLAANLTVAENGSFLIPEGAALTIPDGITLENNGTMHIHDKTSLIGAGALTGRGEFLIDVNEDMISIPEDLAYTGEDYTDQITLEGSVTIYGVVFTADTEGWTRNIDPAVVKDAGEYTVTFTKDDKEISKIFTVAECLHTGLTFRPGENGRHTGTCQVCGEEVEEDCQYPDSYKTTADGHVFTCMVCGGTKTEAHTIELTATANGNTVALSRGCATCGYGTIVGTVNITFKEVAFGETGTVAMWSRTVPEQYAMLIQVDDGRTIQSEASTGSWSAADLFSSTTMAAGRHKLKMSFANDTGKYSNVCELDFTVAPAPLTDSMVELSETEFTYNGTEQKPSLIVKQGQTTLAEGVDYEVSYTRNGIISTDLTSAGTVTVAINGKGNYEGTVKRNFTISTGRLIVKAKDQTITYGGKIGEGTEQVTLTGLCADDNLRSITLTPSTRNVPGGTIRPSGAGIRNGSGGDGTANYDITYETGTLTIRKSNPVIAFANGYNPGKTYDGQAVSNPTADDLVITGAHYDDVKFAWKKYSSEGNAVSIDAAPEKAGRYELVAFIEETMNTGFAETTPGLTVTINKAQDVPDMPADMDNVSNSCRKVGDVPLPEGWEWQASDRDTALTVGAPVAAVAVYIGADKENYVNLTVTVNITRSACDHIAGAVVYTGKGEKAPTCTETGLGHTACTRCGDVMEEGITVPAMGHDYDEGKVTREPTVEAEGERTYTCIRCSHTYTEPIPKKVRQGLWIDRMEPSVSYTGAAVRQEEIKVYYGTELLREKVDYTISYKNNTRAGTAQIIVTGKGNYTGKATETFTILPVDVGVDTRMAVMIETAVETGKALKPAATVTWNGKKLKEKTDYTLSCDTSIKTAGAYDVTVSGKGNYTGSVVKTFQVKPRGTKLLKGAKVTGIKKSYLYQGSGLASDLQNMVVKIGNTTLIKDTDYTVRTENTDAVGTAAIVIEAAQTSAYAGEKRIAISITGTDLRKGSITGVEKLYSYTGVPVTPEITVYSGRNGKGEVVPVGAYTVSYTNNTDKGKATVTATGIPEKGYAGSVKVSYQIGRLDLAAGKADGNLKVVMPADIKHAKGGATPQPVITYTYDGATRTLREGADYTLKYSNHTTAAGIKPPTVKITGIGNYSGSITENFAISRQDIGRLPITVTDRAYGKSKKASAYYSAPKVYDLDGKLLRSGRDYTVQYIYADSGQPVGINDKMEVGTKLRTVVTAHEKSSYTGTLSAEYAVREKQDVRDLAKVKNDKVANQQYTGSAIMPEVRLYTRTGKIKNYLTDESYEVIGCYNNINRGTATILIKGKGVYSGVKRITFKIVQKKILFQ